MGIKTIMITGDNPLTATAGAAAVLRRNLLVYGVGGLLIPFAGIKGIDLLLTLLHLV